MQTSKTKSYLRFLIDFTLVVLTLIGGYLATQSGLKRYSLSTQVARIEKRIGVLPISDPTLVHIQAIKTDDPLDFQWRIYFPANYRLNRVLEADGASQTSYGGLSGSSPKEMIARIQFRVANGVVECCSSFGNIGTFMVLQQQIYVAAIREKLEELEIERLGKDGCVTLEPDREFTLMNISVPPELLHSLKVRFPESEMREARDGIFRAKFEKP